MINFKIENFRYGINEWGIHFQDKMTGAIFSIIQTPDESGNGKLKIAICSQSIKQKNKKAFENFLTYDLGISSDLRISGFKDIVLEQCYIAPNTSFKPYIYSGEIAFKHNYGEIIRIRKLCFGMPEFYSKEKLSENKFFNKIIQDLFQACSKEIKSFLWNDPSFVQMLYREEFDW